MYQFFLPFDFVELGWEDDRTIDIDWYGVEKIYDITFCFTHTA